MKKEPKSKKPINSATAAIETVAAPVNGALVNEDAEKALAEEILKLLRLGAGGANSIALPIGVFEKEAAQTAVERCAYNGWIRLVDVRPVPGKQGIWRIFMLTKDGAAHQQIVEAFFANPEQKPN